MKNLSRNLLILTSFAFLAGILFITQGCKQGNGDIPFDQDTVNNHILGIKQAVVFTRNFRDSVDTVQNRVPEFREKFDFGKAERFPRDVFAVLLNQKDSMGRRAAGIRIYYGLDAKANVRQILVPYDVNGNDIINKLSASGAVSIPGLSSAQAAATGGQTIENGQRCPTICDDGSSGLSSN